VAFLPRGLTRRLASRHYAGQDLPGESPLIPADNLKPVDLRLSLEEARALHAALEEIVESGREDPPLSRAYRILNWRILAASEGSGLTRRMSELARQANNAEEYEAARDDALGPILEGLERGENRDP